MEESIADVFFLALLLISVPLYTGARQWMVSQQGKTRAERKNINW